MYLKKAAADADKAEQIRRLHDDFARDKAQLLREARLDAGKETADARLRDATVKRLEKEVSDLKRKVHAGP